jgi:hypothetical protein
MPTFLGRKIFESVVNFEIVKEWLAHCDEFHMVDCSVPVPIRLGRVHVIDCETRMIVKIPAAPHNGHPYVTLSYVWGSAPTESHDDYSLPRHVPRVIEDSILVTKKLGYRYLWVDRYCIPQSGSAEKPQLLRNMGEIYALSAVTIIASGSPDPEVGLPGVSTTKRASQLTISIGDRFPVCSSPALCRDEVQHSTWNTRVSTYQEAHLIRRHLVFSESQVYFQCNCTFQYECLVSNVDHIFTMLRPDTIHNGLDPVFPRSWEFARPQSLCSRIQEYFLRTLSFDSDGLDAFLGILGVYETKGVVAGHLAGVPIYSQLALTRPLIPVGEREQMIIIGLGWYTNFPMVRRKEFPSWTWAGWKTSPRSPRTVSPFFGFKAAIGSTSHLHDGPFLDPHTYASLNEISVGDREIAANAYVADIQMRKRDGLWSIIGPYKIAQMVHEADCQQNIFAGVDTAELGFVEDQDYDFVAMVLLDGVDEEMDIKLVTLLVLWKISEPDWQVVSNSRFCYERIDTVVMQGSPATCHDFAGKQSISRNGMVVEIVCIGMYISVLNCFP